MAATTTLMMMVSIVAWIVLGFLAGCIASRFVYNTGKGLFLDIPLGIAGAIFGGWLATTFGTPGVAGLNVYSLPVAVVSAAVLLFAYNVIFRGAS